MSEAILCLHSFPRQTRSSKSRVSAWENNSGGERRALTCRRDEDLCGPKRGALCSEPGFVGTTRKRSSMIQPRELPKHSTWCQSRPAVWKDLPVDLCPQKMGQPSGRSHGATSTTRALPCLNEEGVKLLVLPLTTFCLSPETQHREGRPQSMWLTREAALPLKILGEQRNGWVPRSRCAHSCQCVATARLLPT